MKWATCTSIDVDAAACAWVIRRDIDPDAEFVFLGEPADVPDDATPFVMDGVELAQQAGRDGNDCGFETVVRRYELFDPTLWRIAEIVHEATFADERYYAPEARGLDALVLGLSLVGNDEHTLAITRPLFDGLYRRFYYQAVLGQIRT
jgi:hypothetical protein